MPDVRVRREWLIDKFEEYKIEKLEISGWGLGAFAKHIRWSILNVFGLTNGEWYFIHYEFPDHSNSFVIQVLPDLSL